MTHHSPIYFDNNATTELGIESLQAMLDEMKKPASNPSSIHLWGRESKKRLSNARSKIAHFLNVSPTEILFTSGGTEGLNLLIKGLAQKGDVLTTKLEHAAILNTLKSFKKSDEIHFIPVDETGQIDPSEIEQRLSPSIKTIILSAVNSETGCKINLDHIAQIAEKANVHLIVDGVALLGKEAFVIPSGVTAMAFSAHKFHGPKGIGFCYINEYASPFISTMTGGPQELNRRGGTENLIGIMGLAAAIENLSRFQDDYTKQMLMLRQTFETKLLNEIQGVEINGAGTRICNTSNIYFKGIDAETLLILLDMQNIMASHGAACSSGGLTPSHVLLGMGYSLERAKHSIRFSFSRLNTLEEVDQVISALKRLLHSISG
ncbi:MAG: cysteine desulfurase [Simkaniaceae bacterium]|nr:cysteine desulfurase [Simkaniaceae bacterium]MCF7852883.1 cysteine desulfurase [Simkaniaceae bacterium]